MFAENRLTGFNGRASHRHFSNAIFWVKGILTKWIYPIKNLIICLNNNKLHFSVSTILSICGKLKHKIAYVVLSLVNGFNVETLLLW